MAEPSFRFPVVCPVCKREELAELPIAGIAAALLKGDLIKLCTSCHDIYWNAQPAEVAQLREYLGIVGAARQTVSASAERAERSAGSLSPR